MTTPYFWLGAEAESPAYVHTYRHIAAGMCGKHGWYSHQNGYSHCDKCEAEHYMKSAPHSWMSQ